VNRDQFDIVSVARMQPNLAYLVKGSHAANNLRHCCHEQREPGNFELFRMSLGRLLIILGHEAAFAFVKFQDLKLLGFCSENTISLE